MQVRFSVQLQVCLMEGLELALGQGEWSTSHSNSLTHRESPSHPQDMRCSGPQIQYGHYKEESLAPQVIKK
jgi:hypothetical protein